MEVDIIFTQHQINLYACTFTTIFLLWENYLHSNCPCTVYTGEASHLYRRRDSSCEHHSSVRNTILILLSDWALADFKLVSTRSPKYILKCDRSIFIYGDYINQQSLRQQDCYVSWTPCSSSIICSSLISNLNKPDLAKPTSTLFLDPESRKYMTVHAACTCKY